MSEEWGKPAAAGCSSLVILENEQSIVIGEKKISKDETITIEGTTGKVFVGEIPTIEADFDDDFIKFMEIADSYRKLKVRTNADTPKDLKNALKFGAEWYWALSD